MHYHIARLVVASSIFAHVAVAQTPTRRFANGTWETVRTIGFENDLLDQPGPLAVDATRIVLFDYGTNTVKSIRLDGIVEWKSGRAGQGPGEYGNPTSLHIDDLGRTLIYDPELARVTVLDRAGKLLQSIPLPHRYQAAVAGRTTSQFLLLNGGSESLVTLADTVPLLKPTAQPPAEFSTAAPITREIIGSVVTIDGHVIAFRWSSRMVHIDRDGRQIRMCTAIDSIPIAPVVRSDIVVQGLALHVEKVDRTKPQAALAVARLGPNTVVLRSSRRPPSPPDHTIDLYAPRCGAYIESRRLPVATRRIAGNDDILVAVMTEPAPHFVVLRWKPAP